MIAPAVASFAVRVALAVGFAVNACWNWVSAVGGSHVPARVAGAAPSRSVHPPLVNSGVRTLK
jgi:hypothetical protein